MISKCVWIRIKLNILKKNFFGSENKLIPYRMKETLLNTSLIHSIQSFHLHKHKVVYLELEYSDYLVAEIVGLG